MPVRIGRNGARFKLDAFTYNCALAHAQHRLGDAAPAEFEQTSLWAALDYTLKNDPEGYVTRIIAMLPKQISFESSLHNMQDDEIDNLILQLKERAVEAKAPPLSPMLIESKVINGHDQDQA